MRNSRIARALRRLDRDQSGAVAILCLASLLIVLMLGLVLYDTIEIANEKVHIQAAADASAFSQASIEARTMNMIAFTNVGKRVTIGFVTAYDAVFAWMKWISGASIVLAIACYAAGAFFAPILSLCGTITQIAAGSTCATLREGQDHLKLNTLIQRFYGPEVRAFNNYQQYMADVTPFWSWTEGVMRGFTNNAPVTMAYPMPKAGDNFEFTARLPVKQSSDTTMYGLGINRNWDALCEKADHTPSIFGNDSSTWENLSAQSDRRFMFLDLLLKSGVGALGQQENSGVADTGGGQDTEAYNPGGGDDEEAFGCDDFAEAAANDSNIDYTPPSQQCNAEGENCVDVDGEIRYPGMDPISLDQNCQAGGFDGVDFECGGGAMAVGEYGTVFLAGTLALIANISLPWPFSRALPKTFKKRCRENIRDRFRNQMGGDTRSGAAWELDRNDWYMNASNLMFAYRPNAQRNLESRAKYDYLGGDYNKGGFSLSNGAPTAQSSGVWAISRGEVAFGGDSDPNLWEPKWGARIRPIGFHQEWVHYATRHVGFTMGEAREEGERAFMGVLATAHVLNMFNDGMITHPYGVSSIAGLDGIADMLHEIVSVNLMFAAFIDPGAVEALPK
ncbi:MAG: TadE/TadG family type IV pilus assembly protein [Bradymonadaceae bacterium]